MIIHSALKHGKLVSKHDEIDIFTCERTPGGGKAVKKVGTFLGHSGAHPRRPRGS